MKTEEKAAPTQTQRQIFEKAATEMFGGDMQRGPYGNLLDRDSHFPEEYKFADVHAAWRMFQIAWQAAEAVNKELLEALENTTQTLRLMLAAVSIDDYPIEARQEVRKEIAQAEVVIAKARGRQL